MSDSEGRSQEIAQALEDLEQRLHLIRRTAFGELLWVLVLGGAMALHLASIVPVLVRPSEVDFAAFVWNAQAWLAGTPYPPTNSDPNAPHTILVFVPFARLNAHAGAIVWTLISYGAMGLVIRLTLRELALRPSVPLVATGLAVLLASRPIADVFVNANMIWPLAIAFTIAWRWYRRGQRLRSAALLGVLASIKPFIAGFLLLYVARRDWLGALALAAGVVLTFAAAIAVTGWATFEAWFNALARIAAYRLGENASVMGFLARTWEPHTAAWLLGSGLIATATYRRLRRCSDVDQDWLVMLLASVLIAPLGWRYYLSMAIGPLCAAVLLQRFPLGLVATLLAVAFAPAIPLEATRAGLAASLGSLVFWAWGLAWWVGSRRDRSERRNPRQHNSMA